MGDQEWLRLVQAMQRAALGQNAVYRHAALGHVRTRRDRNGRLEFHGGDLDRLRERRTPVVRTDTPAA